MAYATMTVFSKSHLLRLLLFHLRYHKRTLVLLFVLLTLSSYLWQGRYLRNHSLVRLCVHQHNNRHNATKRVLVLAYERSGSTFTGGVFDNEPTAFYLYEPLDGVYEAIYGTASGWNVPSDMTTFPNGSVRTRPDFEVSSVRESLRKVFSCDFYTLPVEVTISNYFWNAKYCRRTKRYKSCLNSAYGATLPNCTKFLRPYCPWRLNSNVMKQEKCRTVLKNIRSERGVEHNLNDKMYIASVQYESCVNRHYNNTNKCIKILSEQCMSTNLRVVKAIRAQMSDAAWLLNADPDMYVIHLIRDPRGVVNSRMKISWAKSMAATRSKRKDIAMQIEARIYCTDVIRDVMLRRKLERRYPGRLMEVIYDWHTENHHQGILDIYRFIGIPLSNETAQYIETYEASRSSHWQEELTYKQMKVIDSECQSLYELLPKYWLRVIEMPPEYGRA